jgi:hypothetical protein
VKVGCRGLVVITLQQQQQQQQQHEGAPQTQLEQQPEEEQQQQQQQQQQDVQPAAVVAEVLARMEAGSIQRPRCAYDSHKHSNLSLANLMHAAAQHTPVFAGHSQRSSCLLSMDITDGAAVVQCRCCCNGPLEHFCLPSGLLCALCLWLCAAGSASALPLLV